jgi:hypothetical protein
LRISLPDAAPGQPVVERPRDESRGPGAPGPGELGGERGARAPAALNPSELHCSFVDAIGDASATRKVADEIRFGLYVVYIGRTIGICTSQAR